MIARWVQISHYMAGLQGITNLGYEGFVFYGSNANCNRRLQAASITDVIYPNYDVVYLVGSRDGTVIARGNAEFLNAIYDDVGDAIKGYWAARNHGRVQPHCVKRYFAFYGCAGIFREPMYRFLSDADQATIRFCEGYGNDMVKICWMQDSWKKYVEVG
jgi:hypothetical protein